MPLRNHPHPLDDEVELLKLLSARRSTDFIEEADPLSSPVGLFAGDLCPFRSDLPGFLFVFRYFEPFPPGGARRRY